MKRGVKDITEALGRQYDLCYNWFAGAGVDLIGHSFKDCCVDLAVDQGAEVKANSRVDGDPQGNEQGGQSA